MGDQDDMTLYERWRYEAERSYTKLAEQSGIPEYQLRRQGQREAWAERVRDEDARDITATVEHEIIELSKALPAARTAVISGVSALTSAIGRPQEGTAAPTAIRASWDLLKLFSVTPMRVSLMMLEGSSRSQAVSAHELRDLIASGNTAALVALSQGRQVPDHVTTPGEAVPSDFLSAYADGRAGLGPHSPVSQPGSGSGSALTPEEWDEQQALEAEWVERDREKRGE